MNPFRIISPLRVRESLFARFGSLFPNLPQAEGHRLALVPACVSDLTPTDYSHRFIGWCGFYDLDLSLRLKKLAKEGGLMIDVGANIGYFSVLWGSVRTKNRVLSIEASPRNRESLMKNLAKLRLESPAEAVFCACAHFEGTMEFDLGPSEQCGWGGLSLEKGADKVPVPVKRLDGLIPKGSQIKVLKIDTEGADSWVLMGAERMLRNKEVEHVFFEENLPRMMELGIASGTAERILKDAGYCVNPIGSGSNGRDFHAFVPSHNALL